MRRLPTILSLSRAMHRVRLSSIFEGADPRVVLAFWLFGIFTPLEREHPF